MEELNIIKGNVITPLCYQKICKPCHYMKKYEGFGISNDILKSLVKNEVKLIQIVFLNGKNIDTYIVTVRQYLNSLLTFANTVEDVQRFVALKDMIKW